MPEDGIVKEGVISIVNVKPWAPMAEELDERLTDRYAAAKSERDVASVDVLAIPPAEKSVILTGDTTDTLLGLKKVPMVPLIVVSMVVTEP